MIQLVRLENVLCEAEGCGSFVRVICFWFTDKESEKEYLECSRFPDRGEDLIGDFICKDSEIAREFPVLAEKRIGYAGHGRAKKEGKMYKRCRMSGLAPESLEILAILARKVKEHVDAPVTLEKPAEDEIAKPNNSGHHPQKSKKKKSGRGPHKKVADKRKFLPEARKGYFVDLYEEASKHLRNLMQKFLYSSPESTAK